MAYILILLLSTPEGVFARPHGLYSNMTDCFEAREAVVEQVGRPIVNYQAVCLSTTHAGELL
jgi:hypothetical protein